MSPVGGTADQSLYDGLAVLVTVLAVAYALFVLVRWLRGSRPHLSITAPVMTALGLRVVAAGGIEILGARELFGPDEQRFVAEAGEIAATPFMSGPWLEPLSGEVYRFIFAVQLSILDGPQLALRATQAGIAVGGIALLATAVYELAGRRAALIAAWLLALEPTNVFFSDLLHKEPNMMLAVGLVAFGGSTLWKRGDTRSLIAIALGCMIAVATRPYAGGFLIVAAAAIALHAGIRHRRRSLRSLALIYAVVLLGVVAAPMAWRISSPQNLQTLQESQEAGVAKEGGNLGLERVDFSTRQAVIVNLPRRVRDVIFRPYPWQLGSAAQRFGLLGTIFALVLLALLVWELVSNRGHIMDRAGPLVYVGVFLLIAYSLSAANAGIAFRHRSQVVAVAICMLVVLWAARRKSAPSPAARRPEFGPISPVPRPSG
jgi:Dolichyl-phosphate-mannose-protein mannosyltransferase